MRSLLLASAALLVLPPYFLAASPQAASTAKAEPAQPQDVTVTSAWDACPVEFSASRRSVTDRVAIGDTAPARRGGQGVQLLLQHPRAGIRSAEVLVHAASNRLRVLPLNGIAADADLTRRFHLSGPPTGNLHSADLWLDGAGSIISVDLISITYNDGSVWNRSRLETCSAVPNGFMLVSSR